MKIFVFFLIITIKLALSEWSLKELSKSYEDRPENSTKRLNDRLPFSNYLPTRKGQFCENNNGVFKLCDTYNNNNPKLRVLVIDQLPVMPTQLGCGKRVYHLLEGLVGLGIEVIYYYTYLSYIFNYLLYTLIHRIIFLN